MEAILLVVHVVIALALIGVVLLQRSEQDGFGMGSGSGSNFMTGRQSANLLTRATAVLATLFMLNSLVLTILAADRSEVSIVDRIERAQSSRISAPLDEEAAGEAAGEDLPDAPVAEEMPPAPVAD